MKGLILAGGMGTRLYPLTNNINKHILPVFDKPMIYYPLSTLMLSGIKEFIILSTEYGVNQIQKVLDNGNHLGIEIDYVIQKEPSGIASAINSCIDFIPSNERFAVILGDNLFFGSELSQKVSLAMQQTKTSVFVYTVKDPRRFGVIGFDNNGLPNSIEEKPSDPQSNFAITGLYFFNYQFFEDFRKIEPSSRGEYEITDILKARMKDSDLDVNFLRRGYSWVDAGTFESMFLASRYVELHQSIQGYKIASPEEIAIRNNWTSLDRLIASSRYPKDFLHNLKNYL